MANRITLNDPITVNLDTTGQFSLGDAADGVVGSWVVQISGTFSGSLVYRKKVRKSSVADASAGAASYSNSLTDPTEVTMLTAAVTAAGLHKIRVDGCVLILDYTATSGTMVLECLPVIG